VTPSRRRPSDVLVTEARALRQEPLELVRESSAVPNLGSEGPYRFFFYSNESGEPAHVHVRRERKLAKFWLQPVGLADSKRFAAHELREIEELVQDRRAEFLEAWNEYFGR
jgi:hypothetical protein